MKIQLFVLLIIILAVIWFVLAKGDSNNQSFMSNPTVLVTTNMGDFELELFADKTPLTVANFTKLVSDGFYNGTLFHRVIDSFMIQGGDPNTKTDNIDTYGMGGPGYAIVDEFVPGLSNVVGTISMANAGPGTGGSQFFVNVDNNSFLDGKHTVFGKVTKGMDVVIKISKVPTVEPGIKDRPATPITVESIVVTE